MTRPVALPLLATVLSCGPGCGRAEPPPAPAPEPPAAPAPPRPALPPPAPPSPAPAPTVRLVTPSRPALRGHKGPVHSAVFSPDGRFVLSGGQDETVRLWDVVTGKEVARHTTYNEVRHVAFAPDGRTAYFTAGPFSPHGWEPATGGITLCPTTVAGDLSAVAGDASGTCLLAAGEKHGLNVVELGSGRTLWSLPDPGGPLTSVALAYGGGRVLAGYAGGSVRLWNMGAGQAERTLVVPGGAVTAVAVEGDGRRRLYAGTPAGEVHAWDAATGNTVLTCSPAGPSDSVNCVAIGPGGTRVLAGGSGGSLRLWDATTGKELRTFRADEFCLNHVAFSPTGRYAVSAGQTSLRLWDLEAGEEVRGFEGDAEWVVRWVSCWDSPLGPFLVSAGAFDHAVRVWGKGPDERPGSGGVTHTLRGHTGRVLRLALSADRTVLASAGVDATVRVWDVSAGTELAALRGHAGDVTALAVSRDGKTVLSGGADRTVRLWNVAAGREVWRGAGHDRTVTAVALADDGAAVLSAGDDEKLLAWDVRAGSPPRPVAGHKGPVFQLELAPDGETFLALGPDAPQLRWVADGRPVPATSAVWKEGWVQAAGVSVGEPSSGGTTTFRRIRIR